MRRFDWRVALGSVAALTATVWSPVAVSSAPSEAFPKVLHQETLIQDRFGEQLKAYLLFPADDSGKQAPGKFPVVLHYTYFPTLTWEERTDQPAQHGWTTAGFNLAEGFDRLVRHGYIVAHVGPPGMGGSEGEFDFNKSGHISAAGYDVVEWLAAQPWSTGKIGMYGGSGNGISQLMTAATQPPHLTTIIPAVCFTDMYSEVIYRGGMPSAGDALIIQELALGLYGWNATMLPDDPDEAEFMARANAHKYTTYKPTPWMAEWYSHPTKDDYWNYGTYDLSRITVPVWSWGSWDDHFTAGNFSIFKKVSSPHRMLSVSYNGHSTGPAFDPIAQAMRWFDLWLKGEDHTGMAREMAESPVRYYVPGANQWRTASSWPPAGTTLRLFAGSGAPVPGATGSLGPQAPSSGSSTDTYVYSPAAQRTDNQHGFNAQGIPGVIPRSPNTAANSTVLAYNNPTGHSDQRGNMGASATYLSEPLPQDLEVTGEPVVTLYATSTAADTDFVVKLIDVFSDGGGQAQAGYWDLAGTGWLKATHRHSDVHPEPVPAGEVVEYTIRVFPTSHLFRAGHRIGLQIASSDSRTVPNPNPAVNAVVRTTAHPTHVDLPVVAG